MLGFYASCAAVGIGAAVAAFTVAMFPKEAFVVPVAAVGIVLVLAGSAGAWLCLRAARQGR